MSDSVRWYDAHAAELAPRYESVSPADLNSWLIDFLPAAPALVLDVGAGTGRDAAWFHRRGFEVVAVEPSAGMREEAKARHPEEADRIKWVSDRLPSLSATIRLGVAADVVFLGAVWMHVRPDDRLRAFRKLVSLTRSGGLIAMSIRRGPDDADRGIAEATVEEVERLARGHGLAVLHVARSADRLGRDDVSWDYVVLRLPADGTDALPLLRHVILNDDKVSTYKLALLRSLCRAADACSGMASERVDGYFAVPLGLVALIWLRLYVPLLARGLPQINGTSNLGFAKEPVRRLVAAAAAAGNGGDVGARAIPLLDLRVGAAFSEDEAATVRAAIRDAANTIRRMPANFITYDDGRQIFPFEPAQGRGTGRETALDAAFLESFGYLMVPRDVWRALQRFGAWIEPSIVAEWIRMMERYSGIRGVPFDVGAAAVATSWREPGRDVLVARRRAGELLGAPGGLHCVWSGKRLKADSFDVDHCFPWAIWPCGDLWNLMPADRRINQDRKRDRLVSEDLLIGARGRIMEWWERAYHGAGDAALPVRFRSEAMASLPAVFSADPSTDDVFAAVRFQRLRLRRDQQAPEWGGG